MTQEKSNQEKNTRIGSRGIQCTMAINSSYSWLKFFICWCEFWNETYKTSAIKEKKPVLITGMVNTVLINR